MDFIRILTHWYSMNKRDFPWRGSRDPYTIWVCEVIFQQTRINQGIDYFTKFIKRFPTVGTLAQAEEAEVLKYWEGLGYYSRARNLHFSAQYIMQELSGVFPNNYKDLKKLKGVGDYTAAAIASICYEEKVPAIDGNALRVYARVLGSYLNIAEPKTGKFFKEQMQKYMPNHAGEFNQAIMELGALICTPKNPKCDSCAISDYCKAFQSHSVQELPVKQKKLKIKKESMQYMLYYDESGFVIQQRIHKGIWRNLFELILVKQENEKANFHALVKHKLTHKSLDISFYTYKISGSEKENLLSEPHLKWVDYESWKEYAFPVPIKDFLHTFVLTNKFEKKRIV